MDDVVSIVIFNYNTSQMTNNCINSIMFVIKNIKYKIIIFDNSDQEKYDNKYNLEIIDNTDNSKVDMTRLDGGDTRHTASIQWVLDNLQCRHLIIMDSDTILLHDIDFIEDNVLTVFSVKQSNKYGVYRAKPCICYFNLDLIRRYSVRYYNEGHRNFTGQFFFANVMRLMADNNNKIRIKTIRTEDYLVHFGKGSHHDTKQVEYETFLRRFTLP